MKKYTDNSLFGGIRCGRLHSNIIGYGPHRVLLLLVKKERKASHLKSICAGRESENAKREIPIMSSVVSEELMKKWGLHVDYHININIKVLSPSCIISNLKTV